MRIYSERLDKLFPEHELPVAGIDLELVYFKSIN